ncbi:Signal transduction histidine kinase [Desulfuromusa kysingii]|uniref:histidine kinase n=1 Tax=Desulfuromusa kysingii TaxID=37625 RepID=A0A1H3ZQ69_9BACT|nr:ATP-binding protein [Desulfuromusa kysingii]SEA25755.1 Signal transduction histidine kinase [Desulfuromusa kysingii]
MKHISLKRRLLFGSILICLSITLCISVYQISRLQQREHELVEQQIASFEHSVMPSIREALWNYNDSMVKTIATSQVSQLLTYIEICDSDKLDCGRGGIRKKEPFQEYFRVVEYRTSSFGEGVNVGTVYLQLNHQPFGRLFQQYIFSEFLTNGLGVFGVAISIFLLFHLKAIRRVVSVANYAQNIDLTAMEKIQPLTFDKNNASMDEVDRLVTSINGLIQRVKDEFTCRKKLEQQLNQAQKMEALGALAGGIAHDFNNILAAMLGYVQLCYNAEEKGSQTHKRLERVMVAGERAKDLIAQILIFSRKAETYTKTLCLADIVNEALELVQASLPDGVTIETHLDSDLRMVGDSSQIHQVLLNLATNSAYELAETGGKIQISLTSCQLQSRQAEILGLDAGGYLRLVFCDDGSGIPAEIQDRIFDPFFTTKETGKGTGMGLAVVHGIVQAHGGRIILSPEVDKGSCFTIYFPQQMGVPESETPHRDDSSALLGGDEHILLVDDDAIVLKMGQDMLQSLGYQVSVASSAVAALQLLQKTDRIDLVVTDLNMAAMTGVEFATILKQDKPDMPVILYSGNFDLLDELALQSGVIDKLLQKPFKIEDLSLFVRQVLEPC